MDGGKLTKDKNTVLNRIAKVLTRLDIVLGTVFVMSLLAALVFGIISSVSGVEYVYEISGDSMLPTLQNNALVALEEKPFHELQVGDIILFRHRADTGWEISFSDEDMGSGVAYKSFDLTGDSPEESYKDEGIIYKEGSYTLHRIVGIREADDTGDRALFTRGDNNSGDDMKTVMESGYVARVAWHLNYAGLFIRLMFSCKGVYWLIGICAVLTIAVFVLRIKSEELESSDGRKV